MCTPRNSIRVVMFGLENSGKTTIANHFCKCKKNRIIRIWPNIQHFEWGPLRVTSVDVGPKEPTKKNVFNGAKAVIFVLDSSDYKTFDDAKNIFWGVAKDSRLRRAAVLVLANKCDAAGALLPKQIEDKLGLPCLSKWKIAQTNAKTGDGLCEGLSWIKTVVCPQKKSCIALLSEFLIHLSSSQQQKC